MAMTALPPFAAARVLVCGDVMLDRAWSGATSRVSPEAPVPVVGVDASVDRPGGAANVALGVTALGAACTLVGLRGDDEAGEVLEAALRRAGVDSRLITVPGWRTITKLRVTSRAQQLVRLDFEAPLPGEVAAAVREARGAAVREALSHSDVLVCSDYDKGALHMPEDLLEAAAAAAVPVLVDPKAPDVSRWRGAAVLKPNLAEFVAATGGGVITDEGDLERRGRTLLESSGIGALLVTRGADGMTLFAHGSAVHLPARGREVFDVTGAGDTVAAVLASALAAGASLAEATRLANRAAGLAVARPGAVAIPARDLEEPGPATRVLADRAAVLEAVAAARARGETVVFTNGCFDVLHAGHVAYLEEARALGDRLLVAVNDDASVTRLKGEGRPVNALADRLRVLAGLRAVDWVTAFPEDTPEPLLEAVAPEVLVKGGDYAPEAVVGAELVRARGGRVEVLGLQPGRSTTKILERLGRR
jgi:D-beta-D-heptose 7-phosphate kinase/D-beta-D-heptose 1-phosphate adenosyltransferase